MALYSEASLRHFDSSCASRLGALLELSFLEPEPVMLELELLLVDLERVRENMVWGWGATDDRAGVLECGMLVYAQDGLKKVCFPCARYLGLDLELW